jgi:hypothetical protein
LRRARPPAQHPKNLRPRGRCLRLFRQNPASTARHSPNPWKRGLLSRYPPRLKPRHNSADSTPRKQWRLLPVHLPGCPHIPQPRTGDEPQTGPGVSLELARFCFCFCFAKDILRRGQTIGGLRL